MELIYPKEGVSAQADTPSFSTIILIYKIRIAVNTPLVPLKQIPRVHLVRHVRELVAPALGDDHVAAGLEGLRVVRDLGTEELRRVQRGLVDHHGHALCLHALHDALDGARAEVVRSFKRRTLTRRDEVFVSNTPIGANVNERHVALLSHVSRERLELAGNGWEMHAVSVITAAA